MLLSAARHKTEFSYLHPIQKQDLNFSESRVHEVVARTVINGGSDFQIETEFRSVGFCGGRKTLGARRESNSKLNPHEKTRTGIELGSQRWEASAFPLRQSCSHSTNKITRNLVDYQLTSALSMWSLLSRMFVLILMHLKPLTCVSSTPVIFSIHNRLGICCIQEMMQNQTSKYSSAIPGAKL